MNGDFLVKNDGGGVYGFENIKVMKERKEEEVDHVEYEFDNDGGFEKDGDMVNKGVNDFVR